jgi:hypothetical protein
MRYLDASGGGMFAPVRHAAERLVCAHWRSIKRVAEALSERGALRNDEIDALPWQQRRRYASGHSGDAVARIRFG